ncbi:MAG: hypothetical protein ACI97B_005015, partial [Verrucomicrobiales bacterium]
MLVEALAWTKYVHDLPLDRLNNAWSREDASRRSTVFRQSTRRVISICGWRICFLEASLSTNGQRIAS